MTGVQTCALPISYKTLDSTMLFTQIDDSTNNTNKIEFTLEDFVSDIEDDSTSTIVKIKIVSLPEDGILTVNGNPVQIGDIFDEKTNIVYTPNANQEDTLYGTMSDVGTLSEWGTVNNGVLTTDDGKAIIKAYTNGTLGEVGFASENNNHSHDGLGLGVVGSTDNDQIESTANEKIVIEFKEIVTKAEFGLASLGGNFTPGNSADANAHWVAYKDGVKVAEGDVKQSIDDSNPTTNTFKINVEFDKIEFTTTANVNSNYSIQYMNVDYKIDDSFNYISIDSNGAESELATVTFDLATMCLVKNTPPVADAPTASIDVTKMLVDNNITQLPSNISYVKYYLSDGTTVKINNYINPNTNPSDPTKYIKAIETDTGLKVVDYIINAGTGVYSCRGTYLGNSITNGSSSNIFSTNADYTKTYTSINEVYIFGTVINKVTIDISNVKDITNGYKVEAYNIDGTKGELSEYKTSTENGFGVKGASSGHEAEIGFNCKSEEIRVKFDEQVTDVKVKFSWLASCETALIKFYKNGVEVGSTTQIGLTDTIDGPFTFKPSNGSTFDEIRFMAPGWHDDY